MTSGVQRDRFAFLAASGSALSIFAIGVAAQSAFVYAITLTGKFQTVGAETIWPRLFANSVCVLVVLALGWFVPLGRRRPWHLVLMLAVGAVGGALARSGMQFVGGLYTTATWSAAVLDFGFACLFITLSYLVGLALVVLLRRSRSHELSAARQAARAAAALTALQAEELRVRRDVAEGLHGTVQQRLVLVESRLRRVSDRLDDRAGEVPGLEADLRELRSVANELDEVREVDVREMSQLLYPAGVELGIAQSARMMMRRVPSVIAAQVMIDESTAQWGGGVSERLVVLRVLEEAISNALRHGQASSLSLELSTVQDGTLRLVFDDDGNGLPTPEPTLRGLALLAERLTAVGGSIALSAGPLGGVRLVATMPTG